MIALPPTLALVASNDLPKPGEPNDTPYTPRFLRVVRGGRDDPERQFMAVYHDAVIATVERELVEAKFIRDHWLSHGTRRHDDARNVAFNRQWETALKLAATPAYSPEEIRRKKRAIGSVWLKAEGQRYEPLRQGVAEDEARLAARRQGR